MTFHKIPARPQTFYKTLLFLIFIYSQFNFTKKFNNQKLLKQLGNDQKN